MKMIGQPHWFTRRKYLGWGITPITWQGVLYCLGLVVFLSVVNHLQYYMYHQVWLVMFSASIILVGLDILHVMANLENDERETQHEAIAERNACWVMILVLSIGLIYPFLTSSAKSISDINPFIVVALTIGVLAKSLTNWYIRDK